MVDSEGEEPNPYRPPGSDWADERDRGGDNELVRQKANRALMFGFIGLLCCGIVFGPLAIQRAGEAEALSIATDSGHDLMGRIKAARVLGVVCIVFWALGLIARFAHVFD
jgi:hypothetical protein